MVSQRWVWAAAFAVQACSGFRHRLGRLDRGVDWREREQVEEGGDRRVIIELAPMKQVADIAEGIHASWAASVVSAGGPFKVARRPGRGGSGLWVSASLVPQR